MIPILYDKNEIAFTSNGLGRLRDCISCVVTEERNGIYECDFEYPVNGANFEKIVCGRIIGVTHEESDDIQPFDIISYSKPINGIVSFHAVHISYRQTKMVTWATGISTLQSALNVLETTYYPQDPLGLGTGNPFEYSTDKDTSTAGYVAAFDGTPRSIRSVLGGVEGSILDTYGGEYEWDKWSVILHDARGEAKDLTIRYGVNMTGFQDDTDFSDTYNTCIPYWTNGEGTFVRGGIVQSGWNSVGLNDNCIPLDVSDKFESQPTQAQVEAMGASVMNANRTYLPTQSIHVEFIRLQDIPEYQELSNIFQCELCDTIRVEFPFYNTSATFKIVKTVWNVLKNRYDSMELGDLSTTLSQALGISKK